MRRIRTLAPLVFAHRGATAALPEHTLGAYQRAIEEGADGLECDVRLTRDGHLVCIHDGRLDRTSSGRGRVSAATLDELARLDFGRTTAESTVAESTVAESTVGVLTLDRLVVTALDAGRPLRLLIETKHPSRFAGAVERRLVELLRRHGLVGARVTASVAVSVMSFSLWAVRRVRGLAPTLPTVFLLERTWLRARHGRLPGGAWAIGPSLDLLRRRPELVRQAHERAGMVYVWTVNTPEDIDFVVGLGVDGIISDRPAQVRSRLGRPTG